MSSNQDKIITQYSGGREDGRATITRTSALEFHYTKKHLDGYITKDSRALEIGCATGHYGFYYAEKCKEYVGIDIVPEHIEMFKKKISENNITNMSCQIGDATNLENIESNIFDVVLCLGPMYHLPPEERELVFAECSRVCKTGGIVAFAYINKIGVYAGACVQDGFRDKYPNRQANDYILHKGVDDLKPDMFFFTTPEEMNESATRYGLEKIRNLATDFFITMNVVNDMDNDKFELFMELADLMTRHESCTGMSNHALLICKKG